MRTLGRFSSGSALFVFPSTSLLFLLFLHFAGYKLYFQVRFFLIFTDLFHAGQDARQLRQFCNRLTVIGLHSRFISTVSDKLKLDILIFVRYNKSDNAAVFPHLVIGLLDCTAQVSGFIAVFRGGSFGKGIPHTHFHRRVMQRAASTINRGKGHFPLLVHLPAQE